MFWEIIKNPVIIGIVAGIIVYTYMSWNRKKENEQSKHWMTTHESKHGQYGPKEHFVPHVRLSCKWFETYASSSTETTYAIVQP